DTDGDLDGVIGDGEGDLVFFENFGDNAAPLFGKRVGDNSPFTGFDIGNNSRPVFVDIDGDGDMDMVSGGELNYSELGEAIIDEIGNRLNFFENVGTKSAPVFEERLGADNPLDSVITGRDDMAAFVDLDGDGDMDLFAWSKYDDNALMFYKNTGNARNPLFEKQPEGENPLFFVDTWRTSSIQFVDIDGDGDMDAFTSRYQGYGATTGAIEFYKNVGTATSPRFAPAEGDNPLDMVLADIPWSDAFSLAFVDIDGDGDMDAIVGESSYNYSDGWVHGLRLYENTGSATEPAFTPVEDADTFFTEMAEQGETYYDMFPAFVDIDGDADMDVFVGEDYGRFLFFENTTNEPGPGPAPVPILPESDEGGCFINTAGGTHGNVFTRALTWIHSTVTAMLK
ncbi:MAG: FG-GAP repeat domain-containing protein, partial [Thermodesulfobacteriota bacterium]